MAGGLNRSMPRRTAQLSNSVLQVSSASVGFACLSLAMLTGGCPEDSVSVKSPEGQCDKREPCYCDPRRGARDVAPTTAMNPNWGATAPSRTLGSRRCQDVTQLDTDLESLRPEMDALLKLHQIAYSLGDRQGASRRVRR